MTQARLADIPGKDQSVISRIEKRADMYVSTLAEFIRAMGGELEIRAVFPEGSVRIRRFGDIAGCGLGDGEEMRRICQLDEV